MTEQSEECTRWTVAELAAQSGHTPQHILRLMKQCGVGSLTSNGRGRPTHVLSEDDLDDLLENEAGP
jgi:hypothetical protein